MSDKSNKYGYVGVDIPAQSFGSNKGVFNPAEINELVANNQWTTFGQLELIETKNITSSTSAIDFTDIKENIYNVHFAVFSNFTASASGNYVQSRLSNNGGSSFISSGYQYAHQYGSTTGTFGESKSTSNNFFNFHTENGSGNAGSYAYFYNLGDSSKYSFCTMQVIGIGAQDYMFFGSSVYPTAETINAIRFMPSGAGTINNIDISLYGIRYS